MISFSFVFCGSLLVYCLLNVYIYLERRKYKHLKSPPIPPSPIWFLGALPEFLRYTKIAKGVPLYEFYKVYGWELFVVPIFTRNFIFCMDLEIIHKVCNDRITFPKSDEIRKTFGSLAGERIFGPHGLLNDPGSNLWQAKRKAVDPAFHKAALKTISSDLNMVTDRLINRLKCNYSTDTVNVFEEFVRTGFEIISVAGFNWSPEFLEKHGEETLKQAVTVIDTISLAFRENLTFVLPWSRRQEKQKLKEILPKIRGLTETHLCNRLKNQSNGENDILSHIIRSNGCSDQLTTDDLIDEYLLFLLAGMDTTAIAMSITLFYLAAYPKVLRRARQEVDEVFGDKEELTFEDLNKLVYLEMVIKETLRLKPPAAWTARQCKKHNVVINGCKIPKEAEIFVPIKEIHRDPSHWERPEEFHPDRFSTETRQNGKKTPFLAFSLGQRRCIGRNFAMLEVKTIVSRIIREFEVESMDPNVKDVEVAGAVTSRPLKGVRVRLSERK